MKLDEYKIIKAATTELPGELVTLHIRDGWCVSNEPVQLMERQYLKELVKWLDE